MRNKSQQKKRVIIIFLLIIISFFSVGYAVLAKNNYLFNTENANWDIKISSIETINKIGSASNSFEPRVLSPMSVSFGVDLKKPGDSIIYKIKVKNNGSLDAYLKDILVSENNDNSDIIKYSILGVTKGQTTLNSNNENEIYLKVYYSESENKLVSTTENYVLNFVYEQKRN